MSVLTSNDRAYLLELLDKNILHDVDTHLLESREGVIMVACADGDQMPDVFEEQEFFLQENDSRLRLHTLCLNGGSILIPENSPLSVDLPRGKVLLEDIKGAIKLKNIHAVLLYAHAPCGAAGLAGLEVKKVIDLLVEAKERLKRELEGIKVACFFHVDWGDKKRTYFISAHDWNVKK